MVRSKRFTASHRNFPIAHRCVALNRRQVFIHLSRQPRRCCFCGHQRQIVSSTMLSGQNLTEPLERLFSRLQRRPLGQPKVRCGRRQVVDGPVVVSQRLPYQWDLTLTQQLQGFVPEQESIDEARLVGLVRPTPTFAGRPSISSKTSIASVSASREVPSGIVGCASPQCSRS